MELKAVDKFYDALARAQEEGINITVHLKSGTSFSGKVGDLNGSTLVVGEIVGKEFYDVLVSLDDLSALEAKVRNS